ncbi:hypothetical protein OSTOST_19720 [Ostertagia ostertagi]
MIIAIGAASFMLYLWVTEGANFRRKGKFAKNEGPIKVPPELMNLRSGSSRERFEADLPLATAEKSSPTLFVRLGRAPEATMLEGTDLAVS